MSEAGTAASYGPLLIPFFIFMAEMCVVTISTLRTIFVARGMKGLAPVLGFFEVSTWLFAIGQVMQNLSDVGCYAAFAGGFTVGNVLGMTIERKLALGTLVARPLAEGSFTRPIGILVRKGKYLARAAQAVLDAFKAAGNED